MFSLVTAAQGFPAANTAGWSDQPAAADPVPLLQVRAAVRTLTLNVYQIGDAAVQAFVVCQPASNYFTELAIFIAEQCQARAAGHSGACAVPPTLLGLACSGGGVHSTCVT